MYLLADLELYHNRQLAMLGELVEELLGVNQ